MAPENVAGQAQGNESPFLDLPLIDPENGMFALIVKSVLRNFSYHSFISLALIATLCTFAPLCSSRMVFALLTDPISPTSLKQ